MSTYEIDQITGYHIALEEGKNSGVSDVLSVFMKEQGIIIDTSDMGLTEVQAQKLANMISTILYYA